jgi:hypothetical protein
MFLEILKLIFLPASRISGHKLCLLFTHCKTLVGLVKCGQVSSNKLSFHSPFLALSLPKNHKGAFTYMLLWYSWLLKVVSTLFCLILLMYQTYGVTYVLWDKDYHFIGQIMCEKKQEGYCCTDETFIFRLLKLLSTSFASSHQ